MKTHNVIALFFINLPESLRKPWLDTVARAAEAWEQQAFDADAWMSEDPADLRVSIELGNVPNTATDGVTIATTLRTGPKNFRMVFSDAIRWNPASRRAGWFDTLRRTFSAKHDLLTVAIHELGHVLGLPHVAKEVDYRSAMNPDAEGEGILNKPSARDLAIMHARNAE